MRAIGQRPERSGDGSHRYSTQRGNRFIVQTELVDMVTEAQIWGGKFNRNLEDIFELQEELARHISEKLRLRLSPEEHKILLNGLRRTTRPTSYC